ncbi:hypothetical protein CROQUDRAFT_724949 [Cronartium quercuum f. sp. fusiforme G11]|uniref:VTT domain-containing protein n=1 Tax=Cronartium quercuum f. sp. fusiforme G11 TaxID=708437 RepID=A0A9P6NFH3_9BASI|nr:hypothetical protein CROQUDRAFT_724949 [Cronartium quercuum f. sp. fusiforme G11]
MTLSSKSNQRVTSNSPITHHHHQQNTLQLLNPSASPYVALTPSQSTSKPINISRNHSHLSSTSKSSNQLLSTSQHTLKTLAGGKYYDEYDEDDESIDRIPSLEPSPSQASFPPLSSPSNHHQRINSLQQQNTSNTSNRPPLRVQLQSTNSFVIDLTPPSATLTRQLTPPTTAFSNSNIPIRNRPFNSVSNWVTLTQDRPVLFLILKLISMLLVCGILLLSFIWFLLPSMNEDDYKLLKLPTSFDGLKQLNTLLQVYKDKNYYRVLSSFILIYLFLQTFSLPGSMYLSILSGAMYGVKVGLPIVCLCVGTGALLCYVLSLNLGTTVFIYSPSLRNRLEHWKQKLSTKTNSFDLFAYLVVIRISPLPPHWVVNLLAPHVGIDIKLFWLSTCLGILPVTLIHTQLGTTLDQMVGPEDLSFFNSKNLTSLFLIAIAILIPVGIRWYFKKDLEGVNEEENDESENRRRIGLSLDDSLDPQTTTGEEIRRPNRIRSLSGQSYDNTITSNSSVSSLIGLNRSPSTDTLLISLSRRTSSPNTNHRSKSLTPIEQINLDEQELIDDDLDSEILKINKKSSQPRRSISVSGSSNLPLNGSKASRILGLSHTPTNNTPNKIASFDNNSNHGSHENRRTR